jgi:uncharacterized phage protein gp47/JayE
MLADLPSTDEEALAELRADLQAQGSRIANTSAFSPFFRLLGAIFASPLLYVRRQVLEQILPSLFVKTATGAALDTLAYGLDETRKPASSAVGLLTFRRDGTSGDLAIPLGTMVESPPIDGVVYRLITSEQGLIADGADSALVPAEAEAPGAAWNLGDGYYSLLADVVPGIVAVANEAGWLTSPGRDVEDDEAFRMRLRLKWRRQSGWHTADTYRSLISDVAGIDPGDVYFDLSAPRGPGSADAYLLTASGIPSQALVDLADAHINAEGNHGLGDDLQVKAMPALPVDVDVTITAAEALSAADKAQLAADAQDLIRAAFRENAAYPEVERVAPFNRVARSYLAGAIHNAFSGVVAVDWTLPAADPEPNLALPVLGSLTVTVG